MRFGLAIPLVLVACKVREQPPITDVWEADFKDGLGELFFATGDGYHVEHGALSAHGAHNHPLWLRKKLPHDVRIELDAWSTQAAGDIKVEVFGDGHSYDPDGGRYTATGYEVIFGGWGNAKSIIARLDEHGSDLAQRVEPKVVPNKHYHWRIERRHNVISWFIDEPGRAGGEAPRGVDERSESAGGGNPAGSAGRAGGEAPRGVDERSESVGGGNPAGSAGRAGGEVPRGVHDPEVAFLRYEDPRPLEGAGHDYFGFNNWETDTWFDNLVVTPL